MIRLISTFVFCLFAIVSFSQENAYPISSAEWRDMDAKRETFCGLPIQGWINAAPGSKPWIIAGKLNVVIWGSLTDAETVENLKTLTRIQRTLPQIKVVYLERDSTMTEELVKRYVKVYEINLPVNRISADWCMDEPYGALFVSPTNKVISQIDGLIDSDILIQHIEGIENILMDLYQMDRRPFYPPYSGKYRITDLISAPTDIVQTPDQNTIYISDYTENRVIVMTSYGELLDIFGAGRAGYKEGSIKYCQWNGPRGMAYDAKRNVLYVADSKNFRIRGVDLINRDVFTVLGDGKKGSHLAKTISKNQGSIDYPIDLSLSGDHLYFSTASGIFDLDLNTEVATRITSDEPISGITGLAANSEGDIAFTIGNQGIIGQIEGGSISYIYENSNHFGKKDGKLADALFHRPTDLKWTESGLLVLDQGNAAIRLISNNKKKVTTDLNLDTDGPVWSFDLIGDELYYTNLYSNIFKSSRSSSQTSKVKMSNYLPLSIGNKESLKMLNDGPELKLGPNTQEITFSIQLDSLWKIDPSGYSYAQFNSNLLVNAADDNATDLEVTMRIDPNELTALRDLTLDLFLYVIRKDGASAPIELATAYSFPFHIDDMYLEEKAQIEIPISEINR